jgi:hypothetical protein
MKKYFVSYGDDNYKLSKVRIEKEAIEFNYFDQVGIYGPEHLSKDFLDKTTPYIQNARGGGYWLWKPFVLKKTFDEMAFGDLCVYADAGCTFKPQHRDKFEMYCELVTTHESGVLSFSLPPQITERCYTNKTVLEYFKVSKSLEILDSAQFVGGIIFLKKTDISQKLVNEFYSIAEIHPEFFSDVYNNITRDSNLIDHRHDQSIFSLLRKRYSTCVYDGSNFLYPDDKPEPIVARRLK